MMLKGQDASHIVLGNSFAEDGFPGGRYDYLLANPPFGVEWKKVERAIRDERAVLGFGGRFGAGLPRKELSPSHIAEITRLYGGFTDGERVKILPNGRSGSCGSPWSGRCGCAGRSPTRRWPRHERSRRWPSCTQTSLTGWPSR